MPSKRTRAVAPKAQKRKYPQDTCVGCLTNRAACDDAQRLNKCAGGGWEAHLQRSPPSGSLSPLGGEDEDTISVHQSPVSRSITTVSPTVQYNHPPFPSTLVNNAPPRRDIINEFEEQLATGLQSISSDPSSCVNGHEPFGSGDLVTADHGLNNFHIPSGQGPVGQGWMNFMDPGNPNSMDFSPDLVLLGHDLITEATRTVEELRVEKRRADMSQAEELSLQEKLHRAEMERDLRQAEVKDLEAKLHVAERDRDQAQQSIQEFESQRVKHVEKYHQIRKSLDETCLPYPRVG
ncbi:hypothetical protein LTR93_011451 [Exophiala xenobiotica]|nr:hypothetical protein LTR93_011451 [Exophiala xenobiotica]